MSKSIRPVSEIAFSKRHIGPVIEPSPDKFDKGGSAWGCAFTDTDDPTTTYLYYSGAEDTAWSKSAIGIAVSSDGFNFRKLDDINPIVEGRGGDFNSAASITPAVTRIGNRYYMFFAGSRRSSHLPRLSKMTRIGAAYADDPRGPWTIIRRIASPKLGWEGLSFDLGPSLVRTGDDEVLAYYSNSLNNLPLSLLGMKYMKHLRRRIGIFKITVKSPESLKVDRYDANPLPINGPEGSAAESLFCPGHFFLRGNHYLVPTMSTYSSGFPFQQFIGLVEGTTPFFPNGKIPSVLIDGPAEKVSILNPKSELAFDTPSPIVRESEEVHLYYSAMDRGNPVWKTVMTTLKPSLS